MQAFTHQTKLPGFQLAQATVYQFAGATGGAIRRVLLFQYQYAVSRCSCGLRNTGTMNTGAYYDDIKSGHLWNQLPYGLLLTD